MGMHIVITGNAVDGFRFYGPFNNRGEAIEAAARDHASEDWCVAPLRASEDTPEATITVPTKVINQVFCALDDGGDDMWDHLDPALLELRKAAETSA